MSKYVKEIKTHVFTSELIKGKAYHIIKDNRDFDVLFGGLSDAGHAMFANMSDKHINWFTVKAEDIASGAVKIIELIQPFASTYKIEKPHLDPEYVRDMINDIKNGGGESRFDTYNIISNAINDLNEAHIYEEDLDKAHESLYGIAHQPTVTEKESFFIEPDPNIQPV